jgi:hypothetical protein
MLMSLKIVGYFVIGLAHRSFEHRGKELAPH